MSYLKKENTLKLKIDKQNNEKIAKHAFFSNRKIESLSFEKNKQLDFYKSEYGAFLAILYTTNIVNKVTKNIPSSSSLAPKKSDESHGVSKSHKI